MKPSILFLIQEMGARRMKAFVPQSLLISSCFILGCGQSPKLNNADLTGTYKGQLALSTETLVLNGNGIYQQTIKFKAGKTVSTSGPWRLYYNGDNRIEFKNFLSVDNAGGLVAPRVTRTTLSAPVVGGEGIDIIANADLNEFYRKAYAPTTK